MRFSILAFKDMSFSVGLKNSGFANFSLIKSFISMLFWFIRCRMPISLMYPSLVIPRPGDAAKNNSISALEMAPLVCPMSPIAILRPIDWTNSWFEISLPS